ncbi:hypothetical protein [Phycicoccus ginsengisoli]
MHEPHTTDERVLTQEQRQELVDLILRGDWRISGNAAVTALRNS